jgi:hypothetical protein
LANFVYGETWKVLVNSFWEMFAVVTKKGLADLLLS